ncbi:MAG: hypothetical protein QSU88_01155, partial [Candidatus Methanoperedens sp.]|nr:hypothetical protein [Candidatus Methanoperedens sp.]
PNKLSMNSPPNSYSEEEQEEIEPLMKWKNTELYLLFFPILKIKKSSIKFLIIDSNVSTMSTDKKTETLFTPWRRP